jgi:hypothetical protein
MRQEGMARVASARDAERRRRIRRPAPAVAYYHSGVRYAYCNRVEASQRRESSHVLVESIYRI